ncbi:putative F-box domain-containing protein [Helianthus debilis subsp. tardiflorus]
MSDHIPFEIQSEIMNRLPVKSLIRFRSVCKPWKSLIESSGFVAHYSSQQQHLLVGSKEEYVSFVDDDSFPQHRVSVTLPPLLNNLEYPVLIGNSHGLLCFQREDPPGGRAVIWNPRFGVCRETMDPKIVTITRSESVNPRQVEVFTLTTKAWRSPYSTANLPRKSVSFLKKSVDVDGCLYWLAIDGTSANNHLIISFDITTEDFGEVNLPGSLAHYYCRLSMYKLKESLAVIELCLEANGIVYHVWMMVDGVPKSFQKLYTISSHSPDVSFIYFRGFRKTGQPLIELRGRPGDDTITLAAYEPHSKSISNLGINGREFVYYYMYSCMETLLLL